MEILAEELHQQITLRFVTVLLNVLDGLGELEIGVRSTREFQIITYCMKKFQPVWRGCLMSSQKRTRRERVEDLLRDHAIGNNHELFNRLMDLEVIILIH